HWQEKVIRGGEISHFVQFPNAEFRLEYYQSNTEADTIVATLRRSDGVEVARIHAAQDGPEKDWATFYDLYNESNRYITGWDKVIAEIDAELKQQGKI